jgi:hypothetical protein
VDPYLLHPDRTAKACKAGSRPGPTISVVVPRSHTTPPLRMTASAGFMSPGTASGRRLAGFSSQALRNGADAYLDGVDRPRSSAGKEGEYRWPSMSCASSAKGFHEHCTRLR